MEAVGVTAERGRRVLAGFLLIAAVLFLAHGWRTITGPFGDSHDGRNAGMWAAQSRSLVEQGPLESHVGARSKEMGTYGHHPPLIVVETAAARMIGGSSTAALRAPAWIGSLVALVLLALLLRERGLRSPAVGAAVVLIVATPMFLVYGTMLDTFVTSLPFGLGLLLLWLRAIDGKRVHGWAAALLAAAAVLAGWQGFLLAAILGVWSVVRLVRGQGSRTVNLAFAGGALAGLVLLVGWLFWAYDGSLEPVLDQYLFRSGSSEVPPGLGGTLRVQTRALLTMFGPVVLLLGLGGLVVAVRNSATRALALLSLAVTVPYTLLLPLGAANHDYWNYWFLLPAAVGLAVGGDRLLVAVRDGLSLEPLLSGGATVLATVLVLGMWARPSLAGSTISEGFKAGRVVERTSLPDHQQTAWYAGAVGVPPFWLAYGTGRPAVAVPSNELPRLAASHGDDLVLVGRRECVGGRMRLTQAFEKATEVAQRPPVPYRLHLTGRYGCT